MSAPHYPIPDVNETGRVLAQLDDVRAIFLVLIFVIVLLAFVMLSDRWAERRSSRQAAEKYEAGAKELAGAINKMSQGQSDRTTSILLHHARVESVLGRIEHELTRRETLHGE